MKELGSYLRRTRIENGVNLEEAADDARATIGYVSQKFSLYRKLTIYQNLQYFGLSYGLKPPYLNARIQEFPQAVYWHIH